MNEEEARKAAQKQLEDEVAYRKNHVLKKVEVKIYDIFERKPGEGIGEQTRPHMHVPLELNMVLSGQVPGQLMKKNIAIRFCVTCHLCFFEQLPDTA
jgi:hypothetical protein